MSFNRYLFEYLEAFAQYAQKRWNDKTENGKKPNKEGNLFQQTRLSVSKSEVGNYSLLSRVFNQYPLSYALDDKQEDNNSKSYYACDPRLIIEWPAAYEDILLHEKFIKTWDKDEEAHRFSLTPETQNKVRRVFQKIIRDSCDALLDIDGKLENMLVEYLGLSSLIEAIQLKPLETEKLHFQIMYSYCVLLINSNLMEPLYDKYVAMGENDVDGRSIAFKKLQAIDRFTLSLCIGNENNGEMKIADFFKQQVREVLYDKNLYSVKSFVQRLLQTSVDVIPELIANDLQGYSEDSESEKSWEQELQARKFVFWFEVLEYLQEMKDPIRMHKVLHHLPKSMRDKWPQKDKSQDLSSSEEDDFLSEYVKVISPSHSIFSLSNTQSKNKLEEKVSTEKLRNLSDWFHARDNLGILNHIIIAEVRSLQPRKEIVRWLEERKFDFDSIASPPNIFFQIIFKKIPRERQQDLLDVISAHAPSL